MPLSLAAAFFGWIGRVLQLFPALAFQTEAGAQGPWTALPEPLLTRAAPRVEVPPELRAGRHLILPAEQLGPGLGIEAPHLPLPTWVDLVREEAMSHSQALELHTGSAPILARGSAVEQLRQSLDALDRAGRALDLTVSIAWTEAGSQELPPLISAAEMESEARTAQWTSRSLRSGECAVFGGRARTPFLADYSAEVASDSGVCVPEIGEAWTGRVLYARACRLRSGSLVHIEGLLDLAEIAAMEEFNTQSPDLGVLQQPNVSALQIAFAGCVESGGGMRIVIRGCKLLPGDSVLWIRAQAQPDVREPPWRIFDLALLDSRRESLPLPLPGMGLDGLVLRERGQASSSALPVSVVAGLLEGARERRGRSLGVSSGLLALREQASAPSSAAESLIAAAEEKLVATAQLDVRFGDLRLTAPSSAGFPARVLFGTERPVLRGYQVEVAPESWMPSTLVEHAFDGLLVQGTAGESSLFFTSWLATSEAPVPLPRDRTGLGSLPLQERGVQTFQGRLADDGRTVRCYGGAGSAELELKLTRLAKDL